MDIFIVKLKVKEIVSVRIRLEKIIFYNYFLYVVRIFVIMVLIWMINESK